MSENTAAARLEPPLAGRQTGSSEGMSPAIAAELHQHLYLKERLEAEFPDLDDETLADTLDGETRLNEALAAVLRSREEDLGLAASLKTRIETMRARLDRFQDRAERKRSLVADVMVRAEIKRLVMPDFTASLRTVPPGLVVEDEAQVPEAFWRPQPPKLDRAALSDALRRGEQIAGATLGDARRSITIRTA
ncbi:siphovirus Gp157 family protein [Parvibaculum sp.]|uniref:siphovirus Gp157 family protein n=1 Tax=Parvibaculum sp. TaxID=2024848 RepID=UPI00260DFC3E|nr:siphovirus Gp157 family protein [Parvibaculum sp.]MCW5726942.1 siphovirus Gp157 family protein [Parvibaculum sp.]